jgi:hypothetical protein
MEELFQRAEEETYFDQSPMIGFDPTVLSKGPRTLNTHPISSKIPKGVKEAVRWYQGERTKELLSSPSPDDRDEPHRRSDPCIWYSSLPVIRGYDIF